MEDFNSIVAVISLTMGVAWASGINLYAALLVLGLLGASDSMQLPPDLQVLQSPIVITAAAIMFCVEFFADKVPGVDNGWDSIQTFVRIPAGAVLAAGAVGHVDPTLSVAAGIIGGGVATVTHAAKAGSRILINTSPEPFSNWAVSLAEDFVVIAGLWTAFHYPWLFLAFFVLFILFLIWFLPKLWRGIKKVLSTLAGLFRRRPKEAA